VERIMEPDLLKAREVAQRLDIGLSTVWRWTASGQLPAPFRITRWRRADLDAYIAARRRRFPVGRFGRISGLGFGTAP
jgi:excisionase family DNA binding protein